VGRAPFARTDCGGAERARQCSRRKSPESPPRIFRAGGAQLADCLDADRRGSARDRVHANAWTHRPRGCSSRTCTFRSGRHGTRTVGRLLPQRFGSQSWALARRPERASRTTFVTMGRAQVELNASRRNDTRRPLIVAETESGGEGAAPRGFGCKDPAPRHVAERRPARLVPGVACWCGGAAAFAAYHSQQSLAAASSATSAPRGARAAQVMRNGAPGDVPPRVAAVRALAHLRLGI